MPEEVAEEKFRVKGKQSSSIPKGEKLNSLK